MSPSGGGEIDVTLHCRVLGGGKKLKVENRKSKIKFKVNKWKSERLFTQNS
jgi:hypothetical protein